MKNIKIKALILAAGLLFAGNAFSEQTYVHSNYGDVVATGYGLCVRGPADNKPQLDKIHFGYNSAEVVTVKHVESIACQAKESGEPLTVIGHTDKIGSEKFNEQLGFVRAVNVASELKEVYGVESDVVSAGENEPVVRDCPYVDSHQYVNCLAPNRRVELLIK